jgi:hydroxymethylbilane synthase
MVQKMNELRVVTRGSALALTQSTQLVRLLEEKNPGVLFKIITLTTTGDRVTDRPLSQFRGMGVFVKELEKALLANEADIAIHSLKDVPVERVEGLALTAFPIRKEPFDVLLTKSNLRFEELPHGATIGTSSPRRFVQLRAKRPDLAFKDLRGNVDTRIRKLDEGLYDGIIAAAAGMKRLGKPFHENGVLPMDLCLPAAGQGCLAIECCESDEFSRTVAATVDDAATRLEVTAERDFLAVIGGGCQTPIAVYAKCGSDRFTIDAVIGDPDSTALARKSITVPRGESQNAGGRLAEMMIALCKEMGINIIV